MAYFSIPPSRFKAKVLNLQYRKNQDVRRIFDWNEPTSRRVKGNSLLKMVMTSFSHYHLRCVADVVTERDICIVNHQCNFP